jgi:hypothetical protein
VTPQEAAVDTNAANITAYLARRGLHLVETTPGRWRGPCPFCPASDGFMVDTEEGDWGCSACRRHSLEERKAAALNRLFQEQGVTGPRAASRRKPCGMGKRKARSLDIHSAFGQG